MDRVPSGVSVRFIIPLGGFYGIPITINLIQNGDRPHTNDYTVYMVGN